MFVRSELKNKYKLVGTSMRIADESIRSVASLSLIPLQPSLRVSTTEPRDISLPSAFTFNTPNGKQFNFFLILRSTNEKKVLTTLYATSYSET